LSVDDRRQPDQGIGGDRHDSAGRLAADLVDDDVAGVREQPHSQTSDRRIITIGRTPGPQKSLLDGVASRTVVAQARRAKRYNSGPWAW
jgi:hypothetical protein